MELGIVSGLGRSHLPARRPRPAGQATRAEGAVMTGRLRDWLAEHWEG